MNLATPCNLLRSLLLAALLLALPGALVAQNAEEWGWDEEGGAAEEGDRPVLVVQSTGGDLSAVAADSVAGHPRLRRFFQVQRRDGGDFGRSRPYLLLNVNAAVLPGIGRGGADSVALVISRISPETREVLQVRRFVSTTLQRALDAAGDLSDHFEAVRRHLLREPAWYLQVAHDPNAFVGVGRGIASTQTSAMFEAQTNARRNVERAVARAAHEAAVRFLARRDIEAEFDDEVSMQGSLERLTLAQEQSVEWRDGLMVAFIELRTSVDDAQRAYLETVRHLLGSRRSTERELLAILRGYMLDPSAEDDGSGFVEDRRRNGRGDRERDDDIDEEEWPELNATEVESRRNDGGNWVRMSITVDASDMREALELAQWRAAYEILSLEQRRQWRTIREHRAAQRMLDRHSTTTVGQLRNLPRSRVRATVNVRINEAEWKEWVGRIL